MTRPCAGTPRRCRGRTVHLISRSRTCRCTTCPDPEPVIGEIARVLGPGSQLALAIIHPLNRANEDLDRYFERLRFHDEVIRGGLRMTFDGVDRPLSDYTAALTGHGFVIDRLTEPKPSAEDCRADESLVRASGRPYFLHIRCRLSR